MWSADHVVRGFLWFLTKMTFPCFLVQKDRQCTIDNIDLVQTGLGWDRPDI